MTSPVDPREQDVTARLVAQASTSACGGAGGSGAQASVTPFTARRQAPATVVASARVRSQGSPAASAAQASVCAASGAHSSVPAESLAEA